MEEKVITAQEAAALVQYGAITDEEFRTYLELRAQILRAEIAKNKPQEQEVNPDLDVVLR